MIIDLQNDWMGFTLLEFGFTFCIEFCIEKSDGVLKGLRDRNYPGDENCDF